LYKHFVVWLLLLYVAASVLLMDGPLSKGLSMISRAVRTIFMGSVGLVLASTAQAGIFVGNPTADLPATDYLGSLGSPPTTATLDAVLPSYDSGYTVSGAVDGDPLLDLIQKLTNTSAASWASYTVTISPNAGSTIDPGSIVVEPVLAPSGYANICAFLPNVVVDDALHTVTFSGNTPAEVVPVGQKVAIWITFGVTGDSNGDYGYIVTNKATLVPEPASLTLLGCGVLMLVRKRRR
jgi:hypothetical protein